MEAMQDDVDGPWDWDGLGAAGRALRELEDDLRCGICQDFLCAPVSLPCGHVYCSRCIRSFFEAQNCCPTCRSKANATELRQQHALEAVVGKFSGARKALLLALRGAAPDPAAGAASGASPPRKENLKGAPNAAAPSEKRAYLSKRNYHMMKPQALRDLARSHGLDVSGDRAALTKRLREYTLLYNAECDAARPRPVSAVLRDAKTAEAARRRTSAGLKRTAKAIEQLASGRTNVLGMDVRGFEAGFRRLEAELRRREGGERGGKGAQIGQNGAQIGQNGAQIGQKDAQIGQKGARIGQNGAQVGQGGDGAPPCEGIAVAPRGPFRAVWSERVRRVFYYDVRSGEGSFEVPLPLLEAAKSLVAPQNPPAERPAVLDARVAAPPGGAALDDGSAASEGDIFVPLAAVGDAARALCGAPAAAEGEEAAERAAAGPPAAGGAREEGGEGSPGAAGAQGAAEKAGGGGEEAEEGEEMAGKASAAAGKCAEKAEESAEEAGGGGEGDAKGAPGPPGPQTAPEGAPKCSPAPPEEPCGPAGGAWSCAACTFLNGAGSGRCEMCGQERPAGAPQAPPGTPPAAEGAAAASEGVPRREESPAGTQRGGLRSREWVCPQCTLQNHRSRAACEACGGPAPGAGAQQHAMGYAAASQASQGAKRGRAQQGAQARKRRAAPGKDRRQQSIGDALRGKRAKG